MYLKKEKLNKVIAFAIPVLLFAVIQLCYGIRYDTNDDATIRNIASGAYGADTIHLIYVNIIYGVLIKPLYRLTFANWYVITQIVLVCLSLGVLINIACEKTGKAKGLLISFCAILPYGISLFYKFQYVKCSAVMLTAGLILIADNLDKFSGKTVCGILLTMAGCLLRWDNFYAVGALSACLLLMRFFSFDKNGRKNAVVTMICLFVVCFGVKAVDVIAYKTDSEWNYFTEYNKARMELSDYKSSFMSDENMLGEYGVTDSEYTMLKNWNFYDSERFTAENIKEYADSIPSKGIGETVKDTLKLCLSFVTKPVAFRFALIIIVVYGLVMLKKSSLFAFIGTGAMFFALLFYLQYRERYPDRVDVSLFFAVSVIMLYIISVSERRKADDRIFCGLLCAAAMMSILTNYRVTFADTKAYREWKVIQAEYFDEMSADKEHLYLLATVSINEAAGLDVWKPREKDYFSNIVAYGGWLSNAPHRKRALAEYGVSRPLIDAVDNEKVYLDYHNINEALRYITDETGVTVYAEKTGTNEYADYSIKSEK